MKQRSSNHFEVLCHPYTKGILISGSSPINSKAAWQRYLGDWYKHWANIQGLVLGHKFHPDYKNMLKGMKLQLFCYCCFSTHRQIIYGGIVFLSDSSEKKETSRKWLLNSDIKGWCKTHLVCVCKGGIVPWLDYLISSSHILLSWQKLFSITIRGFIKIRITTRHFFTQKSAIVKIYTRPILEFISVLRSVFLVWHLVISLNEKRKVRGFRALIESLTDVRFIFFVPPFSL